MSIIYFWIASFLVMTKAEKFHKALRKSKQKSLLDRLINFVALHIVIKPFVVRYPNRYQAVLQRWDKMNITQLTQKIFVTTQVPCQK
jgi:hypothetical protein